ncbi:MAG TPA: hypothetical protein VF097_04075 [Actinomycetota bacterium]
MEPLVLIHTAANPTAGLLVKSRLESEDIPVFAKGELEGPYRVGPVYLWVPRDLEVQARLVLAEILGGGLELPEGEDVVIEDERLETGPDQDA